MLALAIFCGFALTGEFAVVGAPTASGYRVSAVVDAIRTYVSEQTFCPRTQDDLINLEYASPTLFVDPWGTSIIFFCDDSEPGGDVTVISAGPDRRFNTDDDSDSDNDSN